MERIPIGYDRQPNGKKEGVHTRTLHETDQIHWFFRGKRYAELPRLSRQKALPFVSY